MNSIGRTNVQILRNDIAQALKAVEAKHGIVISLGNARFSSEQVTFNKVSAIVKNMVHLPTVSGTTVAATPEALEYKHMHWRFGLPADGLGRTFLANGKRFVITGLNARRHKFPVSAKSDSGRAFKFSSVTVKANLI